MAPTNPPWTEQARADLLKRIRSLEARRSNAHVDQATYDKLKAEWSETFCAYAQGLPIEEASRCPLCGTPLKLAIDPFGLDGPWWWSLCPTELPSPEGCEHFQLLQGALELHGRKPAEAGDSVKPGPAVPFVVSRVLEMDGMRVVISSRQLPAGDMVYWIAYYSAKPKPFPNLYQSWRQDAMAVYDAKGEAIGWTIAPDAWDFDLPKWTAAGKLWWIAPADASLTLQRSSPSPFDNLPGSRKRQLIVSGKLMQVSGPNGIGGSPFE